ncbi:MAG: hypothetical protein V9G25_04875 [Acidimicrobiia bacterium]
MKTCIISGVSKGIGESISRDFLERGHKVYGISRTETKYMI